MKTKLILLRHGQSLWNKENLFTGWVDIPMSETGMQEAIEAGKKFADIPVDVIFTSALMRAKMTVPLAMLHHKSGKTPVFIHEGNDHMAKWGQIYSEETKKKMIPVFSSEELNERMYGQLQGKNKSETAKEFGEAQVHIWRRSFDVCPPDGESLEMTAKRAIPFFEKKILPLIKNQKNVFIAAHGNSLRAIIMYLRGLNKEEVVKLELATGDPVIFSYENGKFHDLPRS